MRFERACELAAPLFREARDAGDWVLAADVALVLARSRGNQRRSEEALRWAQEALQAAMVAHRDDVACGAWIEIAREHALLDQGGAAQQAVDQVLALVPALQSPEALGSVYTGLTAVYGEMGLTALAVPAARQAVGFAQAIDDIPRLALTRTNFLIVGSLHAEHLQEPDPEAAAYLMRELWPHLTLLQAEVPQVGSPLATARLHRVFGALLACEQRWEESLREYAALTAMAERQPLPPPLVCTAWIEQGVALQHLGRMAETRACGEAAARVDPSAEPPRRAVELRRRARICELTGRSQEALELLRRQQARHHHTVMEALVSRVATLSARIEEQTLRVENTSLRERNAALQAHVQDVSLVASSDPLTGLLNRRGFEAAWLASSAQPQPRAVALVDLDHFKRINDEHSHTVGDAVLQQVARLMEQALRVQDRLSRHGGEEFAVLMSGLDLGAAAAALERLREAVHNHDWSTIATGAVVTVSIGVVAVRAEEPLRDALERADQWLYEAKRSGRDRVCRG